jgi:transposase
LHPRKEKRGAVTMEEHIKALLPHLDEKQRRLFLASCANSLGWGGLKKVCEISGCCKNMVIRGKQELNEAQVSESRVRKKGGGRKKSEDKHPELPSWIEQIVADSTYGSPENPLTWTTQSLRKIQDEVLLNHHVYVSIESVSRILRELNYSLQGNKKMLQVGKAHPDRNEQFEFINGLSKVFIFDGQPVNSIDTKKKENVEVLDHDFPIKELGKVAPYGVYDISRNEGFINLGTSYDTSEFAAQSILRWWQILGQNTYPDATKIYINCDGGGSNGSRTKLWKTQLQELANITGLEIHVSHLPPGTSKWNKIEHKMFCYISKNWRGRPLISIETVINLIANTTTKQGLEIVCVLDENTYERGIKVTKEELDLVNINRDEFHGEWNYFISPQE